jgi:hypothetical protein
MTNKKEMFSAIFTEYTDDINNKNYINLEDIRTRKGGVVKDTLIFAENEVFNMPTELCKNEYVGFLANLEFKNVEFMDLLNLRGIGGTDGK